MENNEMKCYADGQCPSDSEHCRQIHDTDKELNAAERKIDRLERKVTQLEAKLKGKRN